MTGLRTSITYYGYMYGIQEYVHAKLLASWIRRFYGQPCNGEDPYPTDCHVCKTWQAYNTLFPDYQQ